MRLKLYNIGSCWKGLRISFHVVLLFSKSFHFWVRLIAFCTFLKIPSVLKPDHAAPLLTIPFFATGAIVDPPREPGNHHKVQSATGRSSGQEEQR
jgi:hypothetical protein